MPLSSGTAKLWPIRAWQEECQEKQNEFHLEQDYSPSLGINLKKSPTNFLVCRQRELP
jgi:hypothetical protein